MFIRLEFLVIAFIIFLFSSCNHPMGTNLIAGKGGATFTI
jgi:hypothetical protein